MRSKHWISFGGWIHRTGCSRLLLLSFVWLGLAVAPAARAAILYNLVDLGALGGTSSTANAMNASGQVTGYANTSGNAAAHAFLYSNGSMTDLGTLGGTFSGGDAINDSGQVVGYADTSTGDQDAFLYSNGSMIDLNSVVAPGSDFTMTVADGINDAGDIYGEGTDSSGNSYAFELTPIAVPEPTSAGLLAIGSLLLLRRRARRQRASAEVGISIAPI